MNVLSEIRKEAERQGLSVNSKVNNILTKYVIFDRYVEKEHAVVIPSRHFSFIVDNFDENKLIEEYRSIIYDTIPTDLIQKNITEITFENLIKHFFQGECLYGGSYSDFSYYKDSEGYLCLVFRHNYGIKWSRVISTVFAELIEKHLGYHTTPTILPSSVVLKILERNLPDIV